VTAATGSVTGLLTVRDPTVTVPKVSSRAARTRRRWMPPPVALDAMYIDPAAGSMILQVIAAGVVSVLALARNVRRNLVQGIKSLFTRRTDR
jgi:hypothetical protein